ncbi:phosphoglycerate mutase-like protein [Rickenella mellea]|uniref:Phosphoglycerate mutase-like protein n=1 Tax=Rickenella mellea TaxID=50990 RepID=A0A4Y7QB97_9AGAM|nr:phosphoglycerate mutase-like protein [Rickenella mellea]
MRPPQVPLDVQRYPLAPPELQLEQVHVFIRHGERTPVGVRMSEPPASIPEHWMMCKTGRQFRAAVAGALTQVEANGIAARKDALPAETLAVKRVVERIDGTSVEGECMLGELTDVGRQSTYNYGRALRKLYVERLGFLPDTVTKQNEIYLRSTNMPRTIESLQQITHGLYPSSKFENGITPRLFIRNGKDENMLGNTFACKRLEILLVGFAQAAASAYNHLLEPLDKKLSQYIGGNPIRIDGKPRASGILDTIRACTAHGVKVPPEFEDKSVVDTIEKAVVNEWFADKTEEVRRLAMGRMLDDMMRKMTGKLMKGPANPLKILLHSTHDTSIAAICSTLDVFDEKWPAFTASITFELFSRRDTPPQQSYLQSVYGAVSPFTGKSRTPESYVRMRYQNKNMILPFCAEEGKHFPGSPELCSLAAFKERVKELTPADWESECAPAGRP